MPSTMTRSTGHPIAGPPETDPRPGPVGGGCPVTDADHDPDALLDVRGLTIEAPDGTVLVDDVSFSIARDEVLCVVGESGSGKSLTTSTITGLHAPGLRVRSDSMVLGGTELSELDEKGWRGVRGNAIGMVFQDPMSALNPLRRVGSQIRSAMSAHDRASKKELDGRVVELLSSVGIPDPAGRARQFPHQWSGGMRQRAVIASAIANSPDLIIADEPTTALDVTVQEQVMRVLAEVRAQRGSSMILITHDLGIVAEHADRVAVMYSGRIVETGTVDEIFNDAEHPYTRGLLDSRLGGAGKGTGRARAIPGSPPLPAHRPIGCAFRDRCPIADESTCSARPPSPTADRDLHQHACLKTGLPITDEETS